MPGFAGFQSLSVVRISWPTPSTTETFATDPDAAAGAADWANTDDAMSEIPATVDAMKRCTVIDQTPFPDVRDANVVLTKYISAFRQYFAWSGAGGIK
jgi:hypothetical protein